MDILKQGVSYDFRVIAVNDYGYGTPSTPSPSVSGSRQGQACACPRGMLSPPVPEGESQCCSVPTAIAETQLPNTAWLLQSPTSRCQQHLPALPLQSPPLPPFDLLPHVDPGLTKFPKVTPCPAVGCPHPYWFAPPPNSHFPLTLPAVPQPRKPTRSTRSGGSWWSSPWWGSSSSSCSSSCSSSVGRARSTPRNQTQVSAGDLVGCDGTLRGARRGLQSPDPIRASLGLPCLASGSERGCGSLPRGTAPPETR